MPSSPRRGVGRNQSLDLDDVFNLQAKSISKPGMYMSSSQSVSNPSRGRNTRFADDAGEMSDAGRSVMSTRSHSRIRRKRVDRTRSSGASEAALNKSIESGMLSFYGGQDNNNNNSEDEDEDMLFGASKNKSKTKNSAMAVCMSSLPLQSTPTKKGVDRSKLRERMRRERTGATSPKSERIEVTPEMNDFGDKQKPEIDRSSHNEKRSEKRRINDKDLGGSGHKEPKAEVNHSGHQEKKSEKRRSNEKELGDSGHKETSEKRRSREKERSTEKRKSNEKERSVESTPSLEKKRNTEKNRERRSDGTSTRPDNHRVDNTPSSRGRYRHHSSSTSSRAPHSESRGVSVRSTKTKDEPSSKVPVSPSSPRRTKSSGASRPKKSEKMSTSSLAPRQASPRRTKSSDRAALALPVAPRRAQSSDIAFVAPRSPRRALSGGVTPMSDRGSKLGGVTPLSPHRTISGGVTPLSPRRVQTGLVSPRHLHGSRVSPSTARSPLKTNQESPRTSPRDAPRLGSPVKRSSSKARLQENDSKPQEQKKKGKLLQQPLNLRRPSLNKGDHSPRSLNELEDNFAEEASRASTMASAATGTDDSDIEDKGTVMQFDPTQSDNVYRVKQVASEDSTFSVKNKDGTTTSCLIAEFDDPLSTAQLANQNKKDAPMFDLLGSDTDAGLDSPKDIKVPALPDVLSDEEQENPNWAASDTAVNSSFVRAPSVSGDEDAVDDEEKQSDSDSEDEDDNPRSRFQTVTRSKNKSLDGRFPPVTRGRAKSFDTDVLMFDGPVGKVQNQTFDEDFDSAKFEAGAQAQGGKREMRKKVRRKKLTAAKGFHKSTSDNLDPPSDSEVESPRKPRRRLKKTVGPDEIGEGLPTEQLPVAEPLSPENGKDTATEHDMLSPSRKHGKRGSLGMAIGRYFGGGRSRRSIATGDAGGDMSESECSTASSGSRMFGRGGNKKHLLLGDSCSSMESDTPF